MVAGRAASHPERSGATDDAGPNDPFGVLTRQALPDNDGTWRLFRNIIGRRLSHLVNHEDRVISVVDGAILVAGQELGSGRMMVFLPGDRITVAEGDRVAGVMIPGGATFSGLRTICRNVGATAGSTCLPAIATNMSRRRTEAGQARRRAAATS